MLAQRLTTLGPSWDWDRVTIGPLPPIQPFEVEVGIDLLVSGCCAFRSLWMLWDLECAVYLLENTRLTEV